MRESQLLLCAAGVLLAACGTKPLKPSDQHIQQSPAAAIHASGTIPQPIRHAVVLPPPKAAAKVETYSVVVTNLPAREILFALARDAKINIDIHPGIEGNVTLNAIDQTLPQILDRISQQVAIRYELNDGPNRHLVVMPDAPYLKNYKIDYVNMSRDADGGISNTSQIGGGAVGGAGAGAGSNNSQLSIKNASKNHFWDTLVKNITDILNETDKEVVVGRRASSEAVQSSGEKAGAAKTENENEGGKSSAAAQQRSSDQDFKEYRTLQAASVISNPEAGIITVRATGKQHAKIQEFIVQVIRSARRQVLIEATIAEVRLNSNYQQGINWSALALGGTGFTLTQLAQGNPLPPATNTASIFTLGYTNPASKLGDLSGAVKLLDSFGDVKVLSSPKLSVLNNQTAILRVVDNNVYFIVNSTVTACSPKPCDDTVAYTTTMNSVQVGFTMSVTPQINDSDTVLLNVRPTITRRLADKVDPTPGVISNLIPQVSTREMESILKIENNQIAILGGLMQDEINNQTDGIPLLADIPFFGNAFKNRNDNKIKTELVIFLRPVVIKDASIDGDFAAFRNNLPTADFLQPEISGEGR
ncbi:MAG: type II and III secretion system protein [Sideroxyarcus sp.]|nr:type II and III secretion system protein [Sideroxyarcus sp.]